MKIAIIDYVLEPDKPAKTGLSDVVWSIGPELSRLGHDVHIVGPYTVEPKPVPGITVHRFPQPPIGYRNIFGHTWIVLRAWRTARRIAGLDAIYAPEYLSTGIIAPLSKTPVVLRTPGNIYERIANGNPYDPYTTQVFKLAARSSARFCKLVIASSQEMGSWWRRTGVSDEHLVIIPNGIDTSLFQPPGSRTQRSGDSEPFKMVFAGRLSREKNPAIVIDAAAELLSQGMPVHLDIAGDGPLRRQVEDRVRLCGLESVVKVHGWLPAGAVQSLYTSADVVVMPSLSEPLGRVMLETMACGVCLVASRVGGIRDHVQDGVTGFLVGPGNLQELVQCLASLAKDRELRISTGQNARRYILENLTWPTIASRFSAAIVQHTGPGHDDSDTFKQRLVSS